MKTATTRILSVLMVVCLLATLAATAFAASVEDATIDYTANGSITLYKYDHTTAVNDNAWDDSYVSDGIANTDVNEALTDYAIEGVEFTYLKVADIESHTDVVNGAGKTLNLYGFDKNDALLGILGLDGDDRYAAADSDNTWYFESNVLTTALRTVLAADLTAAKDALEEYIAENGTAMTLTDKNGMSKAEDLPVGLYLLVETKVPENVTCTTNPFLVSVPMTAVNGSAENAGGTYWNYDITVYPKNETGIVDLEKTVRESLDYTGTTEDYAHTATASVGDVLDYQIVSTLPVITSSATYLNVYTFTDTLSQGLTYNKNDVKIEWFSDKAMANKVTEWAENDGKFTVTYDEAANSMTIEMTNSGLEEINASGKYGTYTMRITYAATLNDDAVLGDAGNDNTVTLEWRRTSSNYFDTLTDDCHVHSYGFDMTKIMEGMTDAEAAAEGLYNDVTFNIQNTTDGYYCYNTLFGDLAQKRRAAARKRYWQDPDKRRRYAREYYEKNLKSQKSSQPRIAEKYLPECGLRCAGCTHPDCILPENWYKKNHSHIYYREHPGYFAQYRQVHKQERSEYDRLRYAGNREAILQKQRDHRAQPHVKQQRADYDRRYRAEHRKQDREKHRRYYMAHRDEINARKREKRAAQKQLCQY